MLGISAFAADTVPWSNDFSNYSSSISGWYNVKKYNNSKAFSVSGAQLYLQQCVASYPNDVWCFFTGDGFALDATKGYKFEFTTKTNNTSSPTSNNRFKFCLFKKPASGQLTYDAAEQQIVSEIISGDIHNSDIVKYSAFFDVPETGDYLIGLYAYADYNSRALYFDDFKLVEGSMDAPAVTKIDIVPDANGILKAQVKVTAPTKSIRGEELTALTKIVVNRDGGEVKTFDNPVPGQEYEFTDYVAQPGNHVYSVIAHNDKGPGEEIETISAIGGLPEKQTWITTVINYGNYDRPCWAKYCPDGRIRIEWPSVAGVADYRVETMSGRVIAGGERDTFNYLVRNARGDKDIECYGIYDTEFEAGTEPIGWQYKITKIDSEGKETHMGYTNYICLNNQVPYYPNFRTSTALEGFTVDNENQYGWQFSSNHVVGGLSRPSTNIAQYVNWLVSPGLMLSKDKFYRVKVTGSSDSGVAKYTIKVGKGSYREALDIVVTEDHPMVKGNSNMAVVQTDEMFLSVPEDGQYFVGLTGTYPVSTYSDNMRFQRFDIIEVNPALPDKPGNVQVSYSDSSIKFTVPEKAINGDAVEGLEKIEVLKNGEIYQTITEGLTPGAEMEIKITYAAGVTDVYAIRAYNAAGEGESASATVFVLSTPYSNDFNSKSSLEGFTMINNLETAQNFHLQNDQVRLFYDEAGSDHWLITPPITLNAGQYYQLNYVAKASADNAGHMGVFLGNAAVADSMKQVIAPMFELNQEKNIFGGLHEDWFTVETTGQYYLGYHVTHDPGRHNHEVYLDNLQIAAGVAGTVPAKGDLVVTPAADGSTWAKLTYTAPTKSLNGSALNANSTQAVYFYVNGVQTGGHALADSTAYSATRTFNTYPGQTVSIDVLLPEELPYIFSARTAWNGPLTYVDAFVGINRPSYPTNIVLTETQPYGHIKMTWDAVTTDFEGYALNPELLVYEVMSLQPNPANPENLIEVPVLTDIQGTECEFDAVGKDAAQTMVRYVVRARNRKGEGSQGVLTKYVNVGKPYRMPYRESFAGEDNQPGVKTAIFSETLEGYINWGLMKDGQISVSSGDGDGCFLSMEVLGIGCKGRFFTGKVNLGSGVKPCLSMLVYNYPASAEGAAESNLLEFQVFSYGDRKWHSLGEEKSINEICHGRAGWNKINIDLGDYADQVVICAIDATCVAHTFTSIDNIQIYELPEVDLNLQGTNTPVSVAPGAEFTFTATVANNGFVATTPESAELLVDGEVVATTECTEIPVGETATYELPYTFPIVDLAQTHEVTIRVNCAADADAADNSATATVAMINMELPGVKNLTATNNDKIVTLAWEAPEALAEGSYTETFEDWTQGTANQKGWTTYDGDKLPIIGIDNGAGGAVELPGLTYNTNAAFAVVDVKDGALAPWAEYYFAKSGSKYLMSIKPIGQYFNVDDWMISPLLSGNAQTISFGARTPSSKYPVAIEVLYSEGGMAINDFKHAAAGTIYNYEWKEYTAELPEGAKRFAIRIITDCEEAFVALIDDVTYEPATGDEVALKGYNVYSEQSEALAQTTETTHTFAEALEDGEYVFGVSASYAHGESNVTAVKVLVEAGIAQVSLADGIHVFGGKGCIYVCAAEGLNAEVFDVAGKLITAGKVAADGRIAAANGAYIVRVNGESFKVRVY